MTEPAVGGAPPPGRARRAWQARFGGIDPRVGWGYNVWGCIGVVIAISEIWSAVGDSAVPSLSGTIGHLPSQAKLVLAGVALAVLSPRTKSVRKQIDGRTIRLSPGGRLMQGAEDARDVPFYYLPAGYIVVVWPSVLVALLSTDMWLVGYLIYGLIALYFVLIPAYLAFWFRLDVPFSTLAQTLDDLERRSFLVGTFLKGITGAARRE